MLKAVIAWVQLAFTEASGPQRHEVANRQGKKGYSFRLKYGILLVMKKSLLETNSYLKDPERRKLLLRRSMISSFAIEGIVIAESNTSSVKEKDEPFTAEAPPKSDL